MGFGREGTSTVDVGSGGSDVDVIGVGVESAIYNQIRHYWKEE